MRHPQDYGAARDGEWEREGFVGSEWGRSNLSEDFNELPDSWRLEALEQNGW